MPRSQTPVVSWVLAITSPGLLPSGASKPSAFLSVPLGEISLCPRLYPFRGSITRPASSLPPASYSHCWAGTWSSLLTCWLGFRQVGLEPPGSHPLGNNNPFHGVISNPKVSGLPWREQALVLCLVADDTCAHQRVVRRRRVTGSPQDRHGSCGEARASQVPGPSSSYVPWSNTPPDTPP